MKALLSNKSLLDSLKKYQGAPVLVLGDLMIDHYVFGKVDRISPEAPVPIVLVGREEYKLGGACNVARNIKALGGQALLMGVIGQDEPGAMLQRMLENEKVKTQLIRDKQRKTTQKTRVIAQNQQMVRVDYESSATIQRQTIKKLLTSLKNTINSYPVIILSDYGKGVICQELVQGLRQIISEKTKILVDPKVRNFHLYRETYCITPNTLEASQGSGISIQTPDDVYRAGKKIFSDLHCDHVLITLGSEGMAYFETPQKIWKIPTVAQKVFDVTGAGDTVIALLGLGLSSGATLLESSIISNYAAGIVVGEIGTATVNQEKLRDSISKSPELILEPIYSA